MYPRLVSDLLVAGGLGNPDALALSAGDASLTYSELSSATNRVAAGLARVGLRRHDRVALYLNKCPEHVIGMLAAARIGCIFVPINPILKPHQVMHILQDSGARMLITSTTRYEQLRLQRGDSLPVEFVVLTDLADHGDEGAVAWRSLDDEGEIHRDGLLETDVAAILYTSGSTGRPKGVVLSHRNIVTGALSVAEYLGNNEHDRILALLPLSFDAGMSQLTTAFAVGAHVVLLEYLLPQDVVRACARYKITGITGVPPLWIQLSKQRWPAEATTSLRYFANTGGKMPEDTLARLRCLFPSAAPFLMYGLTEAFRSTYLPPSEVDRRPSSIGKAIPNVEVLVVREDGSPCGPGEPGELVHRGPLVALGYWSDSERTKQRFRPAPNVPTEIPQEEIAVWSGDTVVMDEEGYLYFVGRNDEMIKTSGYRVSPTEVEEIAYSSGLVSEVAAFGVPDDQLGQRIVVVAKPADASVTSDELRSIYQNGAPPYMVPARIELLTALPKNPNGKIDRVAIKEGILADQVRC